MAATHPLTKSGEATIWRNPSIMKRRYDEYYEGGVAKSKRHVSGEQINVGGQHNLRELWKR